MRVILLTDLGLLIVLLGPSVLLAQPAKYLRVADAVRGCHIVVWKDSAAPGAAAAQDAARALAQNYRGDARQVYRFALNGFAAEISETDAQDLSRDFRVKYVEQCGVLKATKSHLGS